MCSVPLIAQKLQKAVPGGLGKSGNVSCWLLGALSPHLASALLTSKSSVPRQGRIFPFGEILTVMKNHRRRASRGRVLRHLRSCRSDLTPVRYPHFPHLAGDMGQAYEVTQVAGGSPSRLPCCPPQDHGFSLQCLSSANDSPRATWTPGRGRDAGSHGTLSLASLVRWLPVPAFSPRVKEASWPLTGGPTLAIWEPKRQSPERQTLARMGSAHARYAGRKLRPRARKEPNCCAARWFPGSV